MISYKKINEIIKEYKNENKNEKNYNNHPYPYPYPYPYIGVRVIGKEYDNYDSEIGDIVPCSYNWSDGEQTEERLDGTSCISIDAQLPNSDYKGYLGNRIWIIGGYEMDKGQDEGEMIIKDAVIIKILYV